MLFQIRWVPLPRTPNVTQILDDFLDTKPLICVHVLCLGLVCWLDSSRSLRLRASKKDAVAKWKELVVSLKVYFDKCLPKLLLYRRIPSS